MSEKRPDSIRPWSVMVEVLDWEGESWGISLALPLTWPPHFSLHVCGSHTDLECLKDKRIRIWSFLGKVEVAAMVFHFVSGATASRGHLNS